MVIHREIPACGARKTPFELGFERNTTVCPLCLGGKREFQAEEMGKKQSLEGMKQIGLYSKLLEYSSSNGEIGGKRAEDLIRCGMEEVDGDI